MCVQIDKNCTRLRLGNQVRNLCVKQTYSKCKVTKPIGHIGDWANQVQLANSIKGCLASVAFVFWNQPPVATIHEPGHSFARHRMKSADQSAALVLSLAFWTVPIFVYLCQVIRPNSYGLHIVTYWVKYCSVTLCFSSTLLVTSCYINADWPSHGPDDPHSCSFKTLFMVIHPTTEILI